MWIFCFWIVHEVVLFCMFIICWIQVSFKFLQADLTFVLCSVFLNWHETIVRYVVKLMRLLQLCRAIINSYFIVGQCIESMQDMNWEKLFVSNNHPMCVHTFSQKIKKIVNRHVKWKRTRIISYFDLVFRKFKYSAH